MDFFARSDLACESFGVEDPDSEGIQWRVEHVGAITLRRLEVRTPTASQRLERPCGVYITLECGNVALADDDLIDTLTGLIGQKLRETAERLTGRQIGSDFCVFVAGLGNEELTADAIGPKTVSRLTATRHLREYEAEIYRDMGCASVATLAPGVLGQTGIETQELLAAVTRRISPNLVLAVDALAARECERLASTVQISDTGIHPGSGVGNRRSAINAETLGVPVIALGVPTVVNSSTLVYDALRAAGIDAVDERIQAVLNSGKSFFVSPKESDVITAHFSKILARAIELAILNF